MNRSSRKRVTRFVAGVALVVAGLAVEGPVQAGGGTAVAGTLKNHATDTSKCTFTIKVRAPEFPNNSYTVEYALTNNKYGLFTDSPFVSESSALSNTEQTFSFSASFDVLKSDLPSPIPKYFKLRLWSRSYNTFGYIDYYVSANRCQ